MYYLVNLLKVKDRNLINLYSKTFWLLGNVFYFYKYDQDYEILIDNLLIFLKCNVFEIIDNVNFYI